MKMYRSLIYKSFKITRRRDKLFIVLILLIATLFSMVNVSFKFDDSMDINEAASLICVFSFILAVLCGMCAGTNNGTYKTDVNTGWDHYIKVLPPTAVQQTVADILIKLIYVLIFGLIIMMYVVIANNSTGIDIIKYALNVFLFATSLSALADTVYSFIAMFAKTKLQLRLMGLAAIVCAGFIFKAIGMMKIDINMGSPVPFGDPLYGNTAYELAMFIGSDKVTFISVSAFAVTLGLYFLALWRSHGRREP